MRILTLLLLLSTTLSAQMVGDIDYGLASYYSDEYQGAKTAYGEVYNKAENVAAHKLYPYNSTVRVKNTENGKSVTVRIIDKGPFIRGRIIELSERAAATLGMIGKSTAQVEVTLLSTPDQPAAPSARPDPVVVVPANDPSQAVVVEPVAPADTDVPTRPATTAPSRTAPTASTAAESPAPAAAPAPASTVVQTPKPARTVSNETTAQVKNATGAQGKPVTKPAFSPGLYQIRLLEPPTGDFGVQVGSFTDLEHAMDKVAQLQNKFFDNILVMKAVAVPDNVYKVILGPFPDMPSAKNYAGDLKSRYKMAGFPVVLGSK